MRDLFAAVLLCALTSPATATTLTYQFYGTIDSALGTFAGQGSTITGLISFDDGLADSASPPSNLTDTFASPTFSGTVFVGAVQASVSNGRVSFLDLATADEKQVRFDFGPVTVGSTKVDFFLTAATGPPLSLTSTLAGDLPILDNLDLTQFTIHGGAFTVRDSSTGAAINQVTFEWVGFSRVVPVNWYPRAAALLLLLGGLVGFVVVRARARRRLAT